MLGFGPLGSLPLGGTPQQEVPPAVEVEQRQPGGGYPVRPTIYLDDKGKPVDLKTYRARLENQALQATKQAVKTAGPEDRVQAREASRQLREAIASGVAERIAQEARASSEILTQLKALLFELEQIAMQEAEDEEELLILLLAA